MSYVDDISLSLSASSGAQSGDIRSGDLIFGGSGGASKSEIPPFLWIGLAVVAVVGLLVWLSKRK